MFTTKGLFSQTKCPNRDKCLIPRCIFSHDHRVVQAVSNGIAQVKATQQVDGSGGDQDGQRKRQKIGYEERSTTPIAEPPPSILTLKPTITTQKAIDNKATSTQTSKSTLVARREISPPPLRRKSQNGASTASASSIPAGSNNITPQKQNAPAAIKAPNVVSTPVKKPEKKEPLNPRARKTAPAVHNIRLRLVQALHDQLKRLNSELSNDANDEEKELVFSDQGLITRALDLEEAACETPTIYSNVVKNKIMVYKRMTVAQWKDERAREIAKDKASRAPLSDTPAKKPEGPPKPIETGLTPEEELAILPRLYTPITELSQHGYVTNVPTPAEIEKAKSGIEASKGWEVLFPGRREEDGILASGGCCTYHFGKHYWKDRSSLDPKAKREKKWRCCDQIIGETSGCTTADHHVFKVTEVKRLAAVLNFAKTPEDEADPPAPTQPVCIDCEMGYTVHGLELLRLTATSWPSGSPLLDVLVRPYGEILDLNSRYSGVYPQDITSAIPYSFPGSERIAQNKGKLRIVDSPAIARTLLFSFLTPSTPIIGHGLENDLNATRFIHPTIIDTALLFPHKAGLPYRNGLKMLMQTLLNRNIQMITFTDGKADGHDSKEDANAAGDLVRFRVGKEWEKMQRAGWKLKNGIFEPPENNTDAKSGKEFEENNGNCEGGDKVDAEHINEERIVVDVSAGSKRRREEMEE
ncbi:exonuclease [Botrytis cinerea]